MKFSIITLCRNKILPTLRKLFRRLIPLCAALFILELVLAISGLPRGLTNWLSCRQAQWFDDPAYVIVLGGNGIPSKTGLIRTYYAAEYGKGRTHVTFVVALPSDNDPDTDSVGRMRDELVLRGISRDDVLLESKGMNTYQQAANIRSLLGAKALPRPIVVVTSPWHTRRALLCFQKQGFQRVTVLAAHNRSAEADLGRNVSLRYGLWSNLSMEAEVARELTALLFYRLKGWI